MKPFNKALFEQYDAVAREKGRQWLASRPGVSNIRDNPERYGPDLLYTLDGQELSLECEVKAVWGDGPFPYKDVQVLERKRKYWVKGTDLFMLNKDATQWVYIKASTILASPTKIVYTKYTSKRNPEESFFIVPVAQAEWGTI